MANQQIIDYIKQQSQLGFSKEQISTSLSASGWSALDIDNSFNIVNSPAVSNQNLPKSMSASQWVIIAIISVVATMLGGQVYVASKTFLKSDVPPVISNETIVPLESVAPIASVVPQDNAILSNPELVFSDQLSSCTKYKTTFNHVLTGEMLEKEILGIVGDKCHYVEQMPNNGKMECKYSEVDRINVAKYYKDVANADSVGTSIEAESNGHQATYIINNKEVENPLEEAMSNGTCVILGY